MFEISHFTRGLAETLFYRVKIDRSEFTLTPFGGQITGWKKDGIDIIFENPEHVVLDGKTAYRGGIPICFPYFGKGQLLPTGSIITPQHGGARTTRWATIQPKDRPEITFVTEQNSPQGYPATTFSIEVTYDFESDLKIIATVTNTGTLASPFQLVFHSYWSTSKDSEVLGIGSEYLDNEDNLASKHEESFRGAFLSSFDRIYTRPSDTVTVKGDLFTATVKSKGSNSVVVWNPGAGHTLKDLAPGRLPPFICVESGLVTPSQVLEAGQRHVMAVEFQLSL